MLQVAILAPSYTFDSMQMEVSSNGKVNVNYYLFWDVLMPTFHANGFMPTHVEMALLSTNKTEVHMT